MIALPAETVDAGFIPSIFGLSLCWIFTYVSSLVTLEASWLASSTSTSTSTSSEKNEGSFLSIARTSLGIPGEILTAFLFYFLLTAIIVAYVSEGGSLVSSINASPAVGSLVFASFFALLGISGTSAVDNINRVFVFGLVLSFICLVSFGLPMVNTNNLLQHSDFDMVYPNVISIGILSFGAQNVVPTLLEYLNYDTIKTRQAILIGSLIPLVLYTIWEGVFLGVIDLSNTNESSKLEVVSVLGKTGGPIVNDLVELFSLCAICSSMAGASVSLIDFFQDAISTTSSKRVSVEESMSSVSKTRLLAAFLALAPPVLLAYSYPDIFLVALEEAGLLGGVSLYGIIPAICILSFSRASTSEDEMPGKLAGGDATLVALAAISIALIIPEVRHLLS